MFSVGRERVHWEQMGLLNFSSLFFPGLLKTKLVAHEDLIMSLNWNKKGDYLLSASNDKVSASQ